MSKPIGQSICRVCGKAVGVGKGTVLEYGASGRVHTQGCLALAQKPVINDDRYTDGPEAPQELAG